MVAITHRNPPIRPPYIPSWEFIETATTILRIKVTLAPNPAMKIKFNKLATSENAAIRPTRRIHTSWPQHHLHLHQGPGIHLHRSLVSYYRLRFSRALSTTSGFGKTLASPRGAFIIYKLLLLGVILSIDSSLFAAKQQVHCNRHKKIRRSRLILSGEKSLEDPLRNLIGKSTNGLGHGEIGLCRVFGSAGNRRDWPPPACVWTRYFTGRLFFRERKKSVWCNQTEVFSMFNLNKFERECTTTCG